MVCFVELLMLSHCLTVDSLGIAMITVMIEVDDVVETIDVVRFKAVRLTIAVDSRGVRGVSAR